LRQHVLGLFYLFTVASVGYLDVQVCPDFLSSLLDQIFIRCQRSSFKVSIEKPILILSLGPFAFLAPPLFVC